MTLTLKRVVIADRPIDEVFDYLSDFKTIEEWDPGVVRARKITPGKTAVGTRYELDLAYGPFSVSMTYTLTVLEKPSKIVLEGRGQSFSAVDTLNFEAVGPQKTRIKYRADLSFKGGRAHLARVLRPLLERIGTAAVSGLADAFNRKPTVPEVGGLSALLDRTVVGGLPSFTRFGYAWARRRWAPVVSSLSGKTVVITGATSGIGLAAARMIAHRGARLILVARNPEKAEAVRRRMVHETGNESIRLFTADMSLLRDIDGLADALMTEEPVIDVLINNAGALYPDRQETVEGFERCFAVNLLGPYALTRRLIPALEASGAGRIINVSSGGMYTQGIVTNDLQFRNEPYDGAKAYARAKRGLVILTELWARELSPKNITVHAMHPGWVRTPGIKEALPEFYRLTDPVLRTPEQGADTLVWLAQAPEAGLSSGLFWLDRTPRITHVLRRTRETETDRHALVEALETMGREKRP
ncbi:hypothetical protein JCM14469_30500 [Desulfatiferula olefinivorans]